MTKKLVQVQVVMRVADVEDGEIGDIHEVGFTVSAAQWKRGWNWERDLRLTLGEQEGTHAQADAAQESGEEGSAEEGPSKGSAD